jgi:acetolactate synthase-1/2/3 large subunit
MYTVQALWTMARERLPVLSIIFSNRSYLILNVEMDRTGAGKPGKTGASMLSLDDPPLDWVAIAKGMGVEGVRCETGEAFEEAVKRGMEMDMPFLIEAVV